MQFDSTLPRDWKPRFKIVIKIACLLCGFFVFANNVRGEITIRKESLLNSEPLRPNQLYKFEARASRTNPHDFQLAPGIEKDPRIGYIEFSATGQWKKSILPKLRDNCQICNTQLTHFVKFKWDDPGLYTVTAKVVDENGVEHDSVTWEVQVGESTYVALQDLASVPNGPAPITVEIWPETSERSGYAPRVGDDMNFEVKATSDDGIDGIGFYLKVKDSFGSGQLIAEKDDFLFDKKVLLYWPTFKVEYAWQTPGEYTMIAKITSKAGVQREIKWNITVKAINLSPTLINAEGLTDLGSLVIGGAPGRVEVSEHFRDPEGDSLYFDEVRVNPATPNIVTLRLLANKNIIEIEPKNPGRAIFYAVARESDGLSATQSFIVTVKADSNRPPVAVGTIPDQSLTDGDTSAPLDLSTYFRDPDADTLTYTLTYSTRNIALAQVIGSQLTVLTLNVGNTTLTVTATDPKGLSTTQTFLTTVTAAPAPNQPPQAVGTIPSQSLTMGTASPPLELSTYFHDPDGGMIFSVESNNPAVATTQRIRSQLTLVPRGIGSATITVTAANSDDTSATQTFTVTVNPAPVQQRPEQVGTISTQYMTLDGGAKTVNVAPYFSSPNALRYTVTASPSGLVTASISGSRVTITPLQAGSVSVFVTARDSQNPDVSAIQTIPVSVSHAIIVRPPTSETFTPPTTPDPAVKGLREGVSVIISDLNPGLTLRVREVPGLNADIVEELGNGVTGTITDGPRRKDGYTWWEIEWDTRGLDIEGWSVEADRGQILFRRPPDVEIQDLDVSKNEVEPGEQFTVDIRVRNNGPGESASTEISVYYSPNRHRSLSDLDGDSDLRVAGRGRVRVPSLRSGRRRDLSLRVEAPTTPGRYYYGALLPSNIHDTDYKADLASDALENNLAGEARVDVTTSPDLIVESISANRSSVDPGGVFRLEATVRNQGIGAPTRTATLQYYRSSDARITNNDTEVSSDTVSQRNLDTHQTASRSESITAPTQPGVYYYGACVVLRNERNTRNNCSGAIAITVRDTAPEPTVENRAPNAIGTLLPRTLSENDAPIAVDVARYFNDPDNTPLTYTANSDNTAVVSADVRGSQVTLTPVGVGNATVTVTANDGVLTATQTLSVSVVAAPTENEAPVAVGVIPPQSLTVDGEASTVDLSASFSDANGDTLTYAAWPDDKNVVRLQRTGTLLTITPKAAGQATVTVRATDPEGLQALQHISVFVNTTEGTALPAEMWMPDVNLRAAVRDALGLGPNDPLTQQAIQELTSLRYLGPDLRANQKITDLTGLEHAVNLEHLDLYAHLISDLRPLAGLAKLRSLYLAGNRIANIRPLTSLPLEGLDLGGNPITDFAPLAELTGLTRLDFWGNRLGDNDLSSITGLTQLTELDLRGNRITDVTPLTKLVNLKKLRLEGNPIVNTEPLRTFADLEIDIEIDGEPPSEPDTEIGAEVPDLVVESIRVGETEMDPGAVFRVDAVVRNQGKAASGAGKVHFYRSSDETISTEDTKVRTSDMPVLAADRTKNRWARLNAPDTPGIYYYGVCIEGVANESDRENNCSTAVNITVGTVPAKPPTVERPTPVPETGVDPLPADSLAKQVFQKHGQILRRRDVKAVLPDVLTTLKEPDIQKRLVPATINLIIKDPDLLKQMVPKISDKFITLMKADAAIKALLSDAQVQTLLQTPAAIDELARLLGISVAPPATANEHWMPDANLRAAVRKALGLKPSEPLTQQAVRGLKRLDVNLPDNATANEKIKDLTGLEHATQLTSLSLFQNQVRDISPVAGLIELTHLNLNNNDLIRNISPVAKLTKLTDLCLNYNQISDIKPVKNLTNIGQLCLIGNQISDINPVKGLTNLWRLALGQNKKIGDIKALKELTKLEDLSLGDNQIRDITPLQNLTNLRALWLDRNQIRDITPLKNLTALDILWLSENQISDITALENMTSLTVLFLYQNQIRDITALTKLTKLTRLWMQGNQIRDITPIENFTNLIRLYLSGNPIADLAPLRRLKAKNPGMEIDIDINAPAAPSAPVLPDETALLPNYPNPFNPETWIPYQLAKATDVTLTIYDVRGVVVRRLALGHRPPGFYYSRGRAAH